MLINKAKATFLLGLFLVTGCASIEKEIPKEVKIPVIQKCPKAQIEEAGPRPELPLENIDEASGIDTDVNTWKATVLILLGYVGALEAENKSQKEALDICSN